MKFGWPSMKVLQIKVRRLKLFGCSLKLLANAQCSLTRKRSVSLIPSTYFTDLEKKELKCFKKSTVFSLHFAPSLRFTLSLQSAFYTQSAFTPVPQSGVCSPQSAFYTDRMDIWNERIDPRCIAGARDTIYLVVGKIHAQRVMFQASAGWLWTENYISNNAGSFSIKFFFLAKIHDLHVAFSVIFLVSVLLAVKRHIRTSLVTPSTVEP